MHIAFIFGRCRRSAAAVTLVKYECDSGNLTGNFARSKILITEKLANGALVTPTPHPIGWYRPHHLSAACSQWGEITCINLVLSDNASSLPLLEITEYDTHSGMSVHWRLQKHCSYIDLNITIFNIYYNIFVNCDLDSVIDLLRRIIIGWKCIYFKLLCIGSFKRVKVLTMTFPFYELSFIYEIPLQIDLLGVIYFGGGVFYICVMKSSSHFPNDINMSRNSLCVCYVLK